MGPDDKLEWLECILNGAIDTFCPTETFKVKLNSKLYVSTKLALLSLKAKEYKRNQNSDRFRELRRLVKKEKREAMSKRIKKVVDDTAGSHAWIKKVEMLCDPAGDKPQKDIVLPVHAEEGLDKQQQAESFAEHISRIRRDYQPLSMERLPNRVSSALADALCSGHPECQDFQVYNCMKARKLTSGVEGDFHPTAVKNCLPELAHPLGAVFREAISTHTWPTN